MNKNIIIIGAARSGKTTLARMISKKLNYSLISLDDIICAFEELPNCNIKHDGNDITTSRNFTPFLIRYLKELSEGPNFYNGIKYVIEGTHIDIPLLNEFINKNKDKYIVIGLVYNKITEEEMYYNIKKYDNEDEWTYYNSDDELKGNIRYFIERNKYYNELLSKYNISTYDTSKDRIKVLNKIVKDIEMEV